MTEVTRRLAEFAAGISHQSMPPDVIGRTQMLVMDNVGIALRAHHDAQSTAALVKGAEALRLDGGRSVVIGDRRGFTPAGAALINGAQAHSLDFDDTHARSSLHPSAPIVPAALAAAEMTGADGEELIPAIIAGYEIQIRLSLALGPSDHYDRGFHPTATCGVFGAVAAAGRLFCLDADQMALAFGIALSQSAGSMQFLVDGAWTKPFHVGHAAMCGLMAATFAKQGFRGVEDAFEGRAGFFHAYAPDPEPSKAVEGLGEVWETMAIGVKPYPSCRYSHAALDALIDLRAANDINAEEIVSVDIGLPETGWKIIGDPEADKQNPTSIVDGQFSMAFCAAVALREGGLAWDDYATHITDKKTMELCHKVKVGIDPKPEALFPDKMSGIARIRTAKGEYEAFVASAKGEPDNFLKPEELLAKFDTLVSPYLPSNRVDELATRLLGIIKESDINEVLRLTRPVPAEIADEAAAAGE
ncbi:MAG TPA: MmgE/PrpD family protein [Rhodospirillales bacterium]|nr:MmgE/PrpD family protein [Rhodospirillales bacterium]